MREHQLVVVAKFLNMFAAQTAVSALEAAGIEAITRRDDCGGLRPQLWLSGIEILVDSKDIRQATEILAPGREGKAQE